ncbi:MAG: pyruvate kinase [Candidatus Nomurabacteria bacterium]|nr:pyruvate kinase [Candidatus Nomurabacteria bacterium]
MERKTNIIATIGPATNKKEMLLKMSPYIDMVRLNFSWGTHEEMGEIISLIRETSDSTGKKIFIIQDLSGPRTQEKEGHHFTDGASEILTEKDLNDLVFGVSKDVDYIALSYVGSAADIRDLRSHIKILGANTKVIAKIERKLAVENIESIIDESDAIMIARGDLGLAYPIEEIPFLERKILSSCKKKNKFVIVATEMLLSMVKKDRPTRAEVTDVAFAVTGGASAVMLSEETAKGDYPFETVEILDRIIRNAETHRVL